jgi:HD-like signal output (HDOD) protein
LITREQINHYIDKIPPAPKALKDTLIYLQAGDLTKAAHAAKEDKALSIYLKVLVNKPIYGFRNEVTEVPQIFGILGVSSAQQTIYNYMLTLLSPAKWSLFKLNRVIFYNLQAALSINWQKILTHLNIDDKEILSAISLLPASIIVSEALFSQKREDVFLLRSVHQIDLNTILKRLCDYDLFDIAQDIARKWEMPESIGLIVKSASGVAPAGNPQVDRLGKWMHLLLFYTLSKPNYIEAELNDFIDFQIEYVEDIYEEFATLMEIQ